MPGLVTIAVVVIALIQLESFQQGVPLLSHYSSMEHHESKTPSLSAIATRKKSINDRLTLLRPQHNSMVLHYCNISNDDNNNHCWEPSKLEGSWVQVPSNETVTATSPNNCPGWRFGHKVCNNGYSMNIDCPWFVDEYRWDGGSGSSLRHDTRFDPENACHVLGNRTILMIGDSIVGQTAAEVRNELVSAGCQDRIQYVLSDTLIDKFMGIKDKGGKNRGPHWSQPINDFLSKLGDEEGIVVYAVGPHIFGEDKFKSVFDETLEYAMKIERDHKNLRFVYKTHHGAGCSETISPLPPDQTAQEWSPQGGYSFNHGNFYARDLYAIGVLKSLGRPFMDLRMLYSRSDAHPASTNETTGHGDCLHHCSPGPLSVIPPILFDLMRNEL
jgi:hypothetical protein